MKGTEQTIAIVVSIIGVALVGFLGMSFKSTPIEQDLAQYTNFQPENKRQPSTSSDDTFSDEGLDDHRIDNVYDIDLKKGGKRKKKTKSKNKKSRKRKTKRKNNQ
jgi:hypothetical protein